MPATKAIHWALRTLSPSSRAAGLCSPAELFSRAAGLLQGRQPRLAVVVLDMSDLQELRDLYGSRVRNAILRDCIARLGVLAGARGFAARTGDAEFTVVLPGRDADAARGLVGKALGWPPRFEHDDHGDEIVVVPEIAIDCADGTDERLEGLHEHMATGIAQRRDAERRRHEFMSRERARYSRPAPLAARA